MATELTSMLLVDNVLEYLNDLKGDTKIGIAYNKYMIWDRHRYISYKTFQRTIDELAQRELIQVSKIIGGSYGSTTLIHNETEES